MRNRSMTLPLLATCAALIACGPGPSVQPCRAACAGIQCGADGCGGSCGTCAATARCSAGACLDLCIPNCSGKQCGGDGCGGACGSCPSGATCTALGICQIPAVTPGCPRGGTCTYLQRFAWSYDCTSASDCVRNGAIGTYGTFEECQTWGCMGGNSSCGDQFGNLSDPRRWSCEACKASCDQGTPTACGPTHETARGCALADSTWGAYWADCICQ